MNLSYTLVVKYSYSAFGECTIKHNALNIATINPFRFKGYYYDNESDMYYCQTRYLVPEWGRWLNPDNPSFLKFENINGMNLFAYCGNNPVMNVDPTGTSFILLAAILLGAAFGALEGYVSAKTNDRDIGWGIALGALGGAFMGLVTGGTSLLFGAEALAGQLMIVGMAGLVTGMSTEALNQVVNNEPINAGNIIAAGISSMIVYSLSYAFSFGVSKGVAYDPVGTVAITMGITMIIEPFMILLGLPSKY